MPQPAPLYEATPQEFSERLAIFNPLTGEPADMPYRLVLGASVVEQGRLGPSGLTPRRLRSEEEVLVALVGPRSPWTVEYPTEEPNLPPVPDLMDQNADPSVNIGAAS